MLIDYINGHQGEFWVFVGFALLALEAWAFGFTSGVALFGALGALCTGILMKTEVLPESWIAGIAGVGLTAALSAALLWRPLLALQRDREPPQRDMSSDLIGHRFELAGALDTKTDSQIGYSGVTWRVRLDPKGGDMVLAAGTWVEVSAVDVGVFWVLPLQGASTAP